jgi:tetratricopeptide (TPR) repeat protein
LYGHGDPLERARIFILLCRQQGIDAAMLAFPTQSIPPRPRPWLPAVQIADQLYLFDTQLGLPIPGPGGRGVATLEQVQQDPQLLSALGVGSANPYEVAPNDLRAVLALMDVTHYDLSRRMALIEQHLSGDYRVILTAAPTSLSQRLQRAAGLDSVAFWRAPMEAFWFRRATEKRLSEDRRAAVEYMVKFAIFESRNALMQARQLHFRGILDSEGDSGESAIKFYLATRIPEAQLDRLGELEELQRSLGLYRARGENDVMWAAKVATTRDVVGRSKEHASYWLGLTQYELGRFGAACEWFERRTLDANPDSAWAQGARYNLGRALEAMGKLAEARKHYLASENSPQHHGNLVRARMLARRIAEQTPDA